MVINSINCSYGTYNYSYVTRGPLLVRYGAPLSRRMATQCGFRWGLDRDVRQRQSRGSCERSIFQGFRGLGEV